MDLVLIIDTKGFLSKIEAFADRTYDECVEIRIYTRTVLTNCVFPNLRKIIINKTDECEASYTPFTNCKFSPYPLNIELFGKGVTYLNDVQMEQIRSILISSSDTSIIVNKESITQTRITPVNCTGYLNYGDPLSGMCTLYSNMFNICPDDYEVYISAVDKLFTHSQDYSMFLIHKATQEKFPLGKVHVDCANARHKEDLFTQAILLERESLELTFHGDICEDWAEKCSNEYIRSLLTSMKTVTIHGDIHKSALFHLVWLLPETIIVHGSVHPYAFSYSDFNPDTLTVDGCIHEYAFAHSVLDTDDMICTGSIAEHAFDGSKGNIDSLEVENKLSAHIPLELTVDHIKCHSIDQSVDDLIRNVKSLSLYSLDSLHSEQSDILKITKSCFESISIHGPITNGTLTIPPFLYNKWEILRLLPEQKGPTTVICQYHTIINGEYHLGENSYIVGDENILFAPFFERHSVSSLVKYCEYIHEQCTGPVYIYASGNLDAQIPLSKIQENMFYDIYAEPHCINVSKLCYLGTVYVEKEHIPYFGDENGDIPLIMLKAAFLVFGFVWPTYIVMSMLQQRLL